MKLTRSVEYALIALSHIARAESDGAILARDIAPGVSLPRDYLFKILKSLVRANILASSRGPQGGYFLVRPVDEITLAEIIEAVEGPIVTAEHFSRSPGEDSFRRGVTAALRRAHQAAADSLSQTTLADLLEQA